jgi:hypothetical protein
MTAIIITVDCDDPSDADWLRDRCVAAVEEKIEEAHDEGRLDGQVVLTSELDHGEGRA